MRIEAATLDRLDAVAVLFDAYRVFYKQKPDLAAAREFIRQRLVAGDSQIFCAVDDDDRTLGFTQLYETLSSVSMRRILILNDLFVDPEARRRGVGAMLLEAARKHAVASGALRLELATQKTNRTAQSVYEAQGWVREEEFYRYWKVVDRAE